MSLYIEEARSAGQQIDLSLDLPQKLDESIKLCNWIDQLIGEAAQACLAPQEQEGSPRANLEELSQIVRTNKSELERLKSIIIKIVKKVLFYSLLPESTTATGFQQKITFWDIPEDTDPAEETEQVPSKGVLFQAISNVLFRVIKTARTLEQVITDILFDLQSYPSGPSRFNPITENNQSPSILNLVSCFFKITPEELLRSERLEATHPLLKLSQSEREDVNKILDKILYSHNIQFQKILDTWPPDLNVGGFLKAHELDSGSQIFVRADFHGDLYTLLLTLLLLQKTRCVDAQFHPVPGFHVVFLGDYMDRGSYELATLALLLKFRMENPDTVHLVRGNHEATIMHTEQSKEKEWILKHEEALELCYETFPLSISIAGKMAESCANEYVEFVHGAPSTLFDPIPSLERKETIIPIEKGLESPCRLQAILEDSSSSDKAKSAAAMLLIARDIERKIFRESLQTDGISPSEIEISPAMSYCWADIDPFLTTFCTKSMRGYTITYSRGVVEALRKTGSSRAKRKGLIRGHQHYFKELLSDKGKVIATTLPIAPIEFNVKEEKIQGLLLTVAGRVKEWKKRPMLYAAENQAFSFSSRDWNFYEPLQQATLTC